MGKKNIWQAILIGAFVLAMATGVQAAKILKMATISPGSSAYLTMTTMATMINQAQGDLEITFLGHGSLMFTFNGKVIHVDPFSKVAEYSKLPKADMLLITHEHGDHLDLKAVEAVRTDKTVLVFNKNLWRQTERRYHHGKR